MALKPTDGKDEMNLAEFPLCALSRRLRPDQKTLRFEDRLLDKGRGEWITRQLTITGSDAYGLPTALDDEVLLGLIQVTRQHDFADRKVPFTRHELLRLLDWRDDSKNYHRLETSLNRWTGVTLYYQKAWWNNAKKCWMDEKFHILDNVWLCHRGDIPPDTGFDTAGAPLSAFVWNEVVFRSFQAGNLKSIDFEFFKSLNSAVAKRLYRFLDKRFWHRDRCEFNLRELACQHLGLAQSYDAANLKRKLLPGIQELEARGFINRASMRFRKVRSGDWQIQFEKGKGAVPLVAQEQPLLAVEGGQDLVARGVSPRMAAQLCNEYPQELIQSQIKVFDWLTLSRNSKVSKNPAGFLVSAIKNNYAVPKEYLEGEKRAQHEADAERQRQLLSRQKKRDAAQEAQRRFTNRMNIESFWNSLSADERTRMEAEALSLASKFQRGMMEKGGKVGELVRKGLLDEFALKRMAEPPT